VTGSDTSANALFATLQQTAAHGAGLDPTLMVAANTSGGVVGKMISPQNLTIAATRRGSAGPGVRHPAEGDFVESGTAGGHVPPGGPAVDAGPVVDAAMTTPAHPISRAGPPQGRYAIEERFMTVVLAQ
jgi:hypothetical protein